MKVFSSLYPLAYFAIVVSALNTAQLPPLNALVVNEGIGRTPDGVTSNPMDENSVGMEDPDDDECEIDDKMPGELRTKNFVCSMTSKSGRDCNISSCTAGGGQCVVSPTGRCCGRNMRGQNAPAECSTNCRCQTF